MSTPTKRRHRRAPLSHPRGLLLAGDIGGTKTRIGLFEVTGKRVVPIEVERFSSHEHGGLEEILDAYFRAREDRTVGGARRKSTLGSSAPGKVRLAAAAFGIAGPVIHGRSETTNLPWVVDERKLARRLRIPVALVNDLEATAYAIPALPPRSVAVLNPGRPVRGGTLALIAAGTGLGEAFALRRNGGFIAGATEGGHSDYAPANLEEIELLKFLTERFGHVSVERVLSGSGLVNVYEFLGVVRPELAPVAELSEAAAVSIDPAASISAAALDGSSRRAAEALRIFVSAYGAEASNFALKVLATGGVYIGGGIAPKILPALQRGAFLRAFLDKGRFRNLLEAMPVKVILDDRAALLGAARVALELASAKD